MSEKDKNVQQPPPRKLKLCQELRTVQSDQLSSLHAKYQQESDLLEEIRDFCKQRSTIERTYAQSLQKLAAQFQQKRTFPTVTEEQKENEQQHRLALQVWKAILDETEKVAKARTTASETLSSQVAEVIKMQKNTRAQTLKKCDEIFSTCQEEVQSTIRDLSKAKKNYCEAEMLAQEARDKMQDAENKLKKGSLKFFQSKSALEKQMSKFSTRREMCDRRSAHMRNEYLLSIAAANSHQQRYYSTDLPNLMTTLDSNFYSRLRDYYSIFATTEIELGTYARACFDKVQGEAELVTREYHLQRFLQKCPVFTQPLQYHFTPVESDEISSMVIDQKESLYLDREARKWATEVAREAKGIDENGQIFQELQNSMVQLKGSDTSSDSGFGQEKDSEQKHETLRETLRKSETKKLKAEAKLNMLRNAGINVDQWLDSAYEAIAKEAEMEAQMKLQQAAKQSAQNEDLNASHAMNSFDSFDDTFDATLNDEPAPISQSPPRDSSIRAVALYSYQAQRDDELTITEHEYLEIIEESEGDGWVKAKNEHGQSGYIPEAYVQVERQHVTRQLSVSSEGSPSWPQLKKLGQPYASSASLTDYEVQTAMANQAMSVSGQTVGELEQPDSNVCFARALYDYQGCSEEELSFSEGCVIKVLKQDDEGDGFWEGELNGRVGVFPSLLVEELGCASAEIVTPELAQHLRSASANSCPCFHSLMAPEKTPQRTPQYTLPHTNTVKQDMGSMLFPSATRSPLLQLPTPVLPVYTQVYPKKRKTEPRDFLRVPPLSHEYFQGPCCGQRSQCSLCPPRPSPKSSPTASIHNHANGTNDPIYTEIEESSEPPSTLPPSLPPPPLPESLPTLSVYTEVDRRRPASADIPDSPTTNPYYTRSAPQSPTMSGLKPVRAAPPPPGKLKKKLFEHQEHPQPETRYGDEGPVTMV